jgi:diadenosine tetraphosphate (Ap4A) HIT family hydrolase
MPRDTKTGFNGLCFVCGIVRDTPFQQESVIYGDNAAIAFLSRPSAQLGHTLVAPIDHRTDVIDSFTSAAYLELQSPIYRVGRALTRTLPTGRLYVMSMGGHQGKRARSLAVRSTPARSSVR